MTEEKTGIDISDSVVMGDVHQNIQQNTLKTDVCPSCSASNVKVMKCQEVGCTSKQFCELCHINCRYKGVRGLRFGSGLRFDSGEGEGPFCSECLEKLERERIERERVERERVERERLERERVERERVERLRLESELDWIEEQQRERIERERPERERLERERLERERLELIKSPLNKKEQTQFEEIRDQFVEVGPPLESLTRDEIGDDPEGYFRVSMDYFIEHLELVITKESYSKIFYNLKRDLIYSAQTRRAEIIEEEQRTQKKAKDDIRIATLVTAVIVGILWWIGFYTDILV